MRKKSIIILVSILSLLNNVSAIELHEALANYYDTNEKIKIAKQGFLNDIEAFPQALSEFLPDISASVSKKVNKTKPKSSLMSSSTSLEQDTLQRAISITQPIFNGGGSVAKLKAANEAFKVAVGKYYAAEQEALLEAVKAYVNYYLAQENFNIYEVSVKSNTEQLEAMEERFKLGEATLTDVATSKAKLAAAEADKLEAFTKFESAKATFIQQIGLEPVDIKLPQLPQDLPASIEILQEKATFNPSIYQLRHKLSQDKASTYAGKAQLLPSVSFQLQAGSSMYNPQSASSSINGVSASSILSLNIPIYTKGGAVYSNIRQLKNQARIDIIQLDNALKTIKSNCTSIWSSFNSSQSRIVAATTAVNAAQISYDGIVQEQMLGAKTILEVLQAEDELNKSKIRKIDAERQHVLSAYEMQALIGQLTAKSMKLKVKYFNPESEMKKAKIKIIGY